MQMQTLVRLTLACVLCTASASAAAQAVEDPAARGAEIYALACAACHGPDGRGMSQDRVGFETPLPDFTDCGYASPETEIDWVAIAHEGGPVRAFSRRMPAFGAALSIEDLRLA